MGYTHGKTIKTFASGDGKYYVDIVARYDGCFRFYEHFKIDERRSYWAPRRMSGICDSAERAEGNAWVMLPWMRDLISN